MLLFLVSWGLGLSWADGIPPIQVVFMCRTEKENKQVALFKQGDNFIYQYGSDMASPELQLVRSSSQVILDGWDGMTTGHFNGISLKNKEYSYTVSSYLVKVEGVPKDMAEVTIAKDDEYIASIKCDSSQHMMDNLYKFTIEQSNK